MVQMVRQNSSFEFLLFGALFVSTKHHLDLEFAPPHGFHSKPTGPKATGSLEEKGWLGFGDRKWLLDFQMAYPGGLVR